MSITKEHTVWCDNCGNWDQTSGTARQALRAVKRSGWRRVKGPDGTMQDFCSGCAPHAGAITRTTMRLDI